MSSELSRTDGPLPSNGHPATLTNDVSRLIVQTLREYSGRGPTKAHTVIGRNSVHCVLGDTLTKAERTLAEGGHGTDVLQSRKRLQDVMRPHMTMQVEKLMGRKVIAFLGDNHISPDLAVESFVLAPEEVSADGSEATS